ncbi:MAG: RNA 2',3'-cyclic phosphodiesterase [Candidatus Pacearchaeota archaeon]|jgi:2'-5' RNA ligase|nr:RNA 2',3'-cyclic phosphodiesterase [Candidatus Pacearchaeota archaeon]MDP7521032.1 RNA 2',3'-cyclic phosphodiesterase [Candidatus Pacearchaeota archaeon]|tara:strand:- start:10167 stop:10706 length:540 start_codon:yes stop_codon:yes gene_type:complete
MRCFVALKLSEHVKSKVFHEFENLQKKNLFNGKFVNKENLHLTLQFLGSISEEEIEETKKELREIKFEKFNCGIGKIGVFNNERFIKVIWVDLISDKIEKLQKQISSKLSKFPSDFKKFESHITTARVKFIINKEELIEELKKINFRNLDFEVNEFVLMKSELTREGPKYKILERFKSF